MIEVKHIFNIHLLKLSESNDIKIAKTEWCEIYKEKKEMSGEHGLCICQHKIKYIIYMYNKYTKKTISVGTSCCKKFKLQQNKLNNRILQDVFRNIFIKGEYKIINNILEYTIQVEEQLVKYIRNKYEQNIKKLNYLLELKNDIQNLIEGYSLNYLQNIFEEIQKQIKKIEEEILKEERLTEERLTKERLTKERLTNEIVLQEMISITKLYEEPANKNTCKCGLMITNICNCNKSNYEFIKIYKNYWCNNCDKWKDRCNIK
jgi:hypothetical protein